jgi:hypothetical protein
MKVTVMTLRGVGTLIMCFVFQLEILRYLVCLWFFHASKVYLAFCPPRTNKLVISLAGLVSLGDIQATHLYGSFSQLNSV